MEFENDLLALNTSSEEGPDFDQFQEEVAADLESCDDDLLSEAEMTDLFNAIMNGENPPARGQRIERETSPIKDERSTSVEVGSRWMEEIDIDRRDLRETMFDTLPEMDIIIRNECIL
jgi:hypothetical protein